MSEVIKIEGGHALSGSVRISGAKNATVALIPAAVLAYEPVVIHGIPNIDDVQSLVSILNDLQVKTQMLPEGSLIIEPEEMELVDLTMPEVAKLRASYYFMGALLGKYKEVKTKMPGGCYLGPRPMDLHIKAFEALGAQVDYAQGIYHIHADELIGAKIFLNIASVGATINTMLAAVYAKGRTVIDNAAKEPEIIDVANFLNKMGAKIRGAGTSEITIDGVERLSGCSHEIIPDRIEAGTYVIIAASVGKNMTIDNIIPQHIDALLAKLREAGVQIEEGSDWVRVIGRDSLKAIDITTLPYPGFATDLQQPLTSLLTQAEGVSRIKETIYADRFKHCFELQRMGAQIDVASPVAQVHGATQLFGDIVTATDLRCGAALVVAGLLAQGVTTIRDTYHIDRGYDAIDEKLKKLGAVMWREEEKEQ